MPAFDAIAVGEALPERAHKPDNAYLFLYNAAIWNAHRIHYDHLYATQVEGYPGIVIDGPLQVDWLTQVVTEWVGADATLVRLATSHRQAAYLGETLRATGEIVAIDRDVREVTVSLAIRNERDEVITPGEAVVHFPAT